MVLSENTNSIMTTNRGAIVGTAKPRLAGQKRRAFQDVTNNASNGVNKKTRLLSNKKKKTYKPRTAIQNPTRPPLLPSKTIVAGHSSKATTITLKRKASDLTPSWTIASDAIAAKGEIVVPAKKKKVFVRPADNIDVRDRHDPLFVTEYVEDMYELYRQQETCISSSSMTHQREINVNMRAILIDWLNQVHFKFRLCPETLHLTIQIIDRFLEKCVIRRRSLQLVGVTALLIASKYEDIYPPRVKDLSYMSDNQATYDDILSSETVMLEMLNYQLSKPTAHTFLVRFSRAAHADEQIAQIASYILEGALLSHDLVVSYLPSELAAASVFVARRSNPSRHPWTCTLEKYTHYTEAQVIPVARAILQAKSMLPTKGLSGLEYKYSVNFSGVATKEYPCDF